MTAATRSSPIPVSIDGRGSRLMTPLASRLNCMKTRFQISSHRSHSQAGPRHARPADVLEVVVLAACPYALLAGGRAHVGALLLAEEDGLELHHARVGEEEGRVGPGNERRRAHARVTVLLEVGQEPLADRAAGHRKAHCTPVTPRRRAPWTRAGSGRRSPQGTRAA